MFEWIEAKRFRNLENLRVDGLSRINLIGGRNNSGKTSLLELLFLFAWAGNPAVAVNANVVRGFVTGQDVSSLLNPWAELFYKWDTELPIKVIAQHHSLGHLSLEVTSDSSKLIESPAILSASKSEIVFAQWILKFIYSENGGYHVETRMAMTDRGFVGVPPAKEAPFEAAILLPRSREGNTADVNRLGVLKTQKRDGIVLNALRIIEPRIQSIEESSVYGSPMIVGDVGLSQLVPLAVMGEGMAKLAKIVLLISSSQNGIALIDEIENGFHHSALENVWKVVELAAEQFNVQVFATTHSYECVMAAQSALKAEDFRYHRLDVVDSNVRCVTYPPESIKAAIRHDLEVR